MPRPNRDLNGCVFAERTWLLRAPCGEETSGLDARAVRQYQQPSDNALRAAARVPGVTLISPVDRMCDAVHCPTYIAGQWIYMDDNHLRHDLGTATRDAIAQMLGLDAWLMRVANSAAKIDDAAAVTRRSASRDS